MSGPFDLVVKNASEVITCRGDPRRSGLDALGPIARGAVGARSGKIAWVGVEAELPLDAVGVGTTVVDAGGGFVGPGFVDPHTHAVFAGERSGEFELRNQGASYLEIGKAGGGIMSTVRATREASSAQLAAEALSRLGRLLEHGVTLAEVKSGYGLDVATELKMLEVVRGLKSQQPVELTATLLCAHAIPEELRSQRERYVEQCLTEIIPAVAHAHLAEFCDAFVEDGAFTVKEARRILLAARGAGLTPRVHADQLSAMGASALAAELGAASADHLEHVDDAGIAALQEAGVVAVLMPTATLFVRQRRFAPGRKLWDAGVTVALASNVNPGSAMSENHALTLGLACLENGLTAAEAYWAATRGGALALRRPEHGQLVVGAPADLVAFSCAHVGHLPYHLGVNHVRTVVKAARIVAHRQDVAWCGPREVAESLRKS